MCPIEHVFLVIFMLFFVCNAHSGLKIIELHYFNATEWLLHAYIVCLITLVQVIACMGKHFIMSLLYTMIASCLSQLYYNDCSLMS